MARSAYIDVANRFTLRKTVNSNNYIYCMYAFFTTAMIDSLRSLTCKGGDTATQKRMIIPVIHGRRVVLDLTKEEVRYT